MQQAHSTWHRMRSVYHTKASLGLAGNEPLERFPLPSPRRLAADLRIAAPAVHDMVVRVWWATCARLSPKACVTSDSFHHAEEWKGITQVRAVLEVLLLASVCKAHRPCMYFLTKRALSYRTLVRTSISEWHVIMLAPGS